MGVGTPESSDRKRCLNCDAPLAGVYCASCGQRDSRPNPTLREFADEWFTEMFHWDGKLPSTVKTLLLEPGRLTEDFLAGRRARWLSPLRLYIICSIAFFLSGPVIERVTGYSAKAVARLNVTGDSSELQKLTDSTTFVNDPEIRDNRLIRAIGAERAWTLITNQVLLKDLVAEAIPKAMFALLPFFALITWLVWRSKGIEYPAHLVFAFHVHASFFLALLAGNLIEPIGSLWLTLVAQLAMLVYSTWYVVAACKRALGGTSAEVFARTTVLGLVYAPAALAVVLMATLIAINAL